jgi:alpha-mannosidase
VFIRLLVDVAALLRVHQHSCHPLVQSQSSVNAVDELSAKSLPPARSFCSLGADNLVVTALKKAERDGAIVLRAVEMDGAPAETSLEFLGRKARFGTVNLLEAEVSPGEQDTLRVKPCEISTVRVSVK